MKNEVFGLSYFNRDTNDATVLMKRLFSCRLINRNNKFFI